MESSQVQSESCGLIDVTSIDDATVMPLKVNNDSNVTKEISPEKTKMPDRGDSILEKLNAECSSLYSASSLLSYVHRNNSTSVCSPVVRKRGRPRKHFPSSQTNLISSPRPSSNASDLSYPSKKKRKRKVKGYPWGPNKKKKKVVIEVRF